MHRTKPRVVFSALVGGLLVMPSQSAIVSVNGGASSEGAAPATIAAPSDALDDCAKSTVNAMPNVGPFGMVGFDEAQGVVLGAPVTTDTAVIPAGTVVDSHMIFLNTSHITVPQVIHDNVTWNFSGPVIGVISLDDGINEANSTGQLGAGGTNYTVVPPAQSMTVCGTNVVVGDGPDGVSDPGGERAAPFDLRGIEAGQPSTQPCPNQFGFDGYTVSGDTITVCMRVAEPGDWIRVITDAASQTQPGRMTGGGSVFTPEGVRFTHGFTLHCDTNDVPNRLQVNWPKAVGKGHLECGADVRALQRSNRDLPRRSPSPKWGRPQDLGAI